MAEGMALMSEDSEATVLLRRREEKLRSHEKYTVDKRGNGDCSNLYEQPRVNLVFLTGIILGALLMAIIVIVSNWRYPNNEPN